LQWGKNLSDKDQSWIEWASYNLASGIPREDIKSELEQNGYSAARAEAELDAILSSPIFASSKKIARNYGLVNKLNETLIELESQTFDFTSVERLSGISKETFHKNYYCLNRPVILTDIVGAWPAIEKWTPSFLRKNFGNETVRFQKGRSGSDHRDCFIDHTDEASFSTFLDITENTPEGESPAYLIAHDRLLDRPSFKPLFDDIIFDTRYFDPDDTHGRVFFWLGPEDSTTPMHRDLGNVFLCQIKGRKLVRLVPSRELHLIYNEHGYHSEADFSALDVSAFPLLESAHIVDVIIEPGEFLFIPVGWWHYVKSLDFTISVTGNNFCFPNDLTAIF